MTERSHPLDDATAQIRASATLAPVQSPRCVVAIVDGPDAGKSVRIDECTGRRLLMGQSPICDVKLTDKTVSRRHVSLEVSANAIRLTDLESTNGTFVNGVLVKEVILRGGETIVLGGTTARIDVEDVAQEMPGSTDTRFGRVLGASAEMRMLYPVCHRLANTEIPLLIEGETGTGKEVLAESIHEASPRSSGPFIVFDCTTISPQLLEAELFGHDRGAYTGAVTDRAGLFEEANGGTLFIDEIGDLDLPLQAKLLRSVERHEIRRVGGSKWSKVDVRIIAATRRDLDREVQARRFRDDLFFRLAVARIELPPLRKRSGDVALLTRCFWTMLGGDDATLPPSLLQRFERHAWPGNVRELYNAVARQLALGDVKLPEAPQSEPERGAPSADFIDGLVNQRVPLPRARQEVTAELERRYVAKMLELHGGNVAAAAAAAGIGRRYFQMLKAKT